TLGQNLGFSGVSAASSIYAGLKGAGIGGAAGAAIGGPAAPVTAAIGAAVGGAVAGMGAGGVTAYRMQGYQQMQEWLDQKNEESIKTNGRPLTTGEESQIKTQYIDLAKQSGMWEAVPEAVGNVAEIAILQGRNIIAAKGGTVGAVAKVIPDRALVKVAKAIAKLGGVFGTEELTETITQMGQHNTNVEAGMLDAPKRDWTNPDDLLTSAKEVLGPTLLLTGVMGGASGGLNMLSKKLKSDPVQQDVESQIDALGPEIADVVRGAPVVNSAEAAVQPEVAPAVAIEEPVAEVQAAPIVQAEQAAAPGTPEVAAAPAIIPEPIRAEVAAMSDRNLSQTAAKDREPIVRQAAAEEIQRRAAAPAAAPVEKPAAAPSDIVMKTLEGKSQKELANLANDNKGEPIGIAAGKLFDQRAAKAAKQPTVITSTPAAEKVDYEAQAAEKGIPLEKFKQQEVGQLNSWAKTGVIGARLELARRAQEGLIQPEQITWETPEAPEAAATPAPTPQAAGEPTAPETKVPRAAPFAQEVKVKGETQARIDKVVEARKTLLSQNVAAGMSAEDKLKEEKAIGMQTAAMGRKIEGRPTAIEKKAARKKLESLYAGKQVTVNGAPAEATGVTSYDKHQVKLQDGTTVFAKKSEIQSTPVTNQDVLNYLKAEGLSQLEQAESIIAPAKTEGEAKYGTAEEPGRQTADNAGAVEKRAGVLPEVQKRHERRVGTLRQVILADASSPADVRKAAGTEGGIVFYPEGYNDPEFQKVSAIAEKYGLEVIPVFSESGSINGMVHRGYVYINMAGGADTTTMETVYHEISHAKGNAETQAKVDTESDAFVQFRVTYSEIRTRKKDTLLPVKLVLDEYAAELDSGVNVRFGITLADGLLPGTSVQPLSGTGGKIQATGDIKYSIAQDKGAQILEEGSKKKFKTIFQIADFLSRRVPIDYQTATSAQNREVERKLSDFLKTSMAKIPEAKGW
ncbi:MAG: hypothetical protein M0Q43_13400, partial [Methanothrix sp.]|nr:hypothetical protein [Methanothrix sp.]